MGLDMYFYKKHTFKQPVSMAGERVCMLPKDAEQEEVQRVRKEIEEKKSYEATAWKAKVKEAYYECGYFRKFNALHNFIVREYADGVDECQDIPLTRENINEILKTCEQIQKSPEDCNELMPAGSGFFFGSTDYDEWYMGSIEECRKMCESWLEEMDLWEKIQDDDEVYEDPGWVSLGFDWASRKEDVLAATEELSITYQASW